MTGEWPQYLIDHRDGDNTNDRWNNLRLATYPQNLGNSKKWDKKKNLPKGVRVLGNRYVARIGVRLGGKKKLIHLGCFKTIEEAHQAYKKAATKLFGEFARF